MHSTRSGITLIEIIVAIALLTILTAITVRTFSLFQKTATLNSTAEKGVSLLVEARAKTLASEGSTVYGVHFETGAITLFQGLTYNPADPTNNIVPMPRGVAVSTIMLNGGGPDVVFQRLTGQTITHGSVTFQLTAEPAETRIITIQATGNVAL